MFSTTTTTIVLAPLDDGNRKFEEALRFLYYFGVVKDMVLKSKNIFLFEKGLKSKKFEQLINFCNWVTC